MSPLLLVGLLCASLGWAISATAYAWCFQREAATWKSRAGEWAAAAGDARRDVYLHEKDAARWSEAAAELTDKLKAETADAGVRLATIEQQRRRIAELIDDRAAQAAAALDLALEIEGLVAVIRAARDSAAGHAEALDEVVEAYEDDDEVPA